MELVFERFNKIIMTGQWGLAMQVYSDLASAHKADRFEQALSWDDRVLMVRSTLDEIVGFMSWKQLEYRKDAYITMSWVKPGHRCHGVYQQMYDQVKRWALEDGCITISSGIYLRNESMLRAAEKAGRKPVYSVFIETIKPVTPDRIINTGLVSRE